MLDRSPNRYLRHTGGSFLVTAISKTARTAPKLSARHLHLCSKGVVSVETERRQRGDVSDFRTVVLDGNEFYIDADGEVVGSVAITAEAQERDQALVYGAAWSAPERLRQEPKYDAYSQAAELQVRAAVRQNLAWAMVEGDDAHIADVTGAYAKSLLRQKQKNLARADELAPFIDKFLKAAERLLKRGYHLGNNQHRYQVTLSSIFEAMHEDGFEGSRSEFFRNLENPEISARIARVRANLSGQTRRTTTAK